MSRDKFGKTDTYNGVLIKLPVDLSAETLQARREWENIFKVLEERKKKKLPTRNTIPSRTSFKKQGEMRTSPDKQKLNELTNIRPALQELLMEVLQVEIKRHYTATEKYMKI